MQITVVGAGIAGLTCANRMVEAGYDVEIWTEQFSPHTTSDVAAAVWYPFKVEPWERVKEWGRATLERLYQESESECGGVRIETARRIFHRPMGDPWWKTYVREFRRLSPSELPSGAVCGYGYQIPVADMSIYLSKLRTRFESAGGRCRVHAVTDLEAVPGWVVNCTGLGARRLVGDETLFPIRGQILRIANANLPRQVVLDTDNPLGVTYIVSRTQDCILGGVAQDHEASLIVDKDTSESILGRCRSYFPPDALIDILDARVGLRPGRTAVRLELEKRGEKAIVHNYGHGGAGVSLAWGCADEVLALLESNVE